ncbi:MAG: hypothetical protein A3F90_19765 [Deltaproteobacteria bacterium RIFCSPLOWO2_12_FULL_60_19]|nr:MAG: hypothetical protein A3F90_19765 [Deltaproteobacteria bacterium RIFCSPLOWO2_12_FULL_60_19]
MTQEKFELALERLHTSQKRRAGAPVILSHGFFAGSGFLDLDEDHSLARYLAEQGFDVWNLSLRGTGRSLKPLKDAPDSWTLDEMIDKDLLPVIRYVQKENGSARVVWLGYELGALLGYGYAEKKGGLGLAGLATIGAPMTFTHREQAPMKGLLKLQESPTWKKMFLSLNGPFLGKFLVPLLPKLEAIFYNRDNLENEIKEKLLAGALVEINPGVLDQLLLAIKRGEFVSAKGDFSYRKNLGKINTPLLLIGGEADKLAPPEAMEIVRREAGSRDRTVRIFGPKAKDSVAYGHMDLILGPKAKQEVFPAIARWLKQRGGD